MFHTTRLTAYTIGPDAYAAAAALCAEYGGAVQPIGGHRGLAAAMPSLRAALAERRCALREPLWYGGECTQAHIDTLCAQCAGARLIAGVGGGKALDTAKAVAERLALPVITLPTIASTCAPVTPLSVVYGEDGAFSHFAYHAAPPLHAFIDTRILAAAPVRYLRAGMGDALAKYYEVFLASRGDVLTHGSAMAKELSRTCMSHLFCWGAAALADAKAGRASQALEESVLAIIVSTGYVSALIDDALNGAVAHSVFYGLTVLPQIEQSHLHGDVVAYGILVQLALDGQREELARVRALLRLWGCPTSLCELQVPCTRAALADVLKAAAAAPDMAHLPYPVSEAQLFAAMEQVEALAAC